MTKNLADGAESKSEIFTAEKGTLRAHVDMYWERLEEFAAVCDKLLSSRRADLEVDLTAVNFISSSYLGCLNHLLLRAAERKKHITIKVGEDVIWLFDIMGARRNLTLEIY